MIVRFRALLSRLRATFSRRPSLDDELRFHLEMAGQDALRRGEPIREAHLRAGNLTQAAELVHDQRTLPWLSDFLRDTRHGARLLARSPLFTAAAIVSLALGIGANTAIFSLIDAVLLRAMPVRDPASLVQFTKHRGTGRGNFSYPMFHDFAQQLHNFDGIFARSSMGRREAVFATDRELVNTEVVSGAYYSILGVSAIAGRTFDESIDSAPQPVAVISYAFCQRRFGMDAAVIGHTFRLNRTVFTIIGVAPPGFFGVVVGEAPDITFPLSMDAEVRNGGTWLPFDGRGWLQVMGRIRRDSPLRAAQAEVSGIFSRMVEVEASHYDKEIFRRNALAQHMRLDPAGNGFDSLRERFSEPLRVLMGIVALVLLIACANLANLLLGRAAVRRREIGVRLAMGAGRGRVIRQLLAEGFLLATVAGAAGVLLAIWSANALVTVMSNGGDRIALNIRPDLRVLSFAAAASFAACLLFSLIPAIQAVRQGIQPALAEARGARWRLGRGLIAVQVAISVVLLIGAALFVRTLLRLYSLENGFDRTGVLVFDVNSAHSSLGESVLRARVLEELHTIPRATSVAFAMSPIGSSGWDGSVRIEGYTFAPNEDDRAQLTAVSPGYFATIRASFSEGRDFEGRDTATSPGVAIVNQSLARRYFAGRSALGKWIQVAGEPDHREIVGIVKDVQPRSQRDAVPPTLYLAATQRVRATWGGFLVRGNVAPAMIDSAVKRIDPKLRLENVHTLEEHLARSILRERIMGSLTGFFGLLSLLLVAIGVYGVMAFQVARRHKEIGIRIALGARPVAVTRMMLAESAVPVAIGVAAGIAGALALTRLAEKMLFGVTPTDPIAFTGACALLVALALAAAWIPARVAARLSPVDALRCE